MSVYLCIPSARPAPEAQACIDKWQKMGYKVAFFRNIDHEPVLCDYLSMGDYQGYARTTNTLIKEVLAFDPECDWVVTGGDDTDPDPNKRADEIAAECSAYFASRDQVPNPEKPSEWITPLGSDTFGVMQPTGDRFAGGSIDRIAGSPWIGREWCERANQGKGPLHPDFWHMFVDEFLMQSAIKLGVFWQRPDLTHHHRHFMRATDAVDSPAISKPTPKHLLYVNSQAHWIEAQALFNRHKANGFAAGDPLPAGDPGSLSLVGSTRASSS